MKTKNFFYALSVAVCLLGVSTNAWAGYMGNGHYVRLRVFTENTAKGLVYATQASSPDPDDNQYRDVSLTDRYSPDNAGRGENDNGGVYLDFHAWAKPARGYKFDKWTAEKFDYVNGNYSDMTNVYESEAASDPEGANVKIPSGCDGIADNLKSRSWGGGKGWEVANSAKAGWLDADKFTVRYKKPKGGTYSVKYSYLKTEGYEFKKINEEINLSSDYADEYWVPEGISANDKGYSFETDEVILSVPEETDNFLGWYENLNGNISRISQEKVLEYGINQTLDIEARFKSAIFDPVEQKTIITNSNTDDEELIIVLHPDCAGDWDASDFLLELSDKQGDGIFTGEIVSYSENDGLKIKITFNANEVWGGSGVTAKIKPEYGEILSISIIALAEEIVTYEARLIVNDEMVDNGTLVEMLGSANSIAGTNIPTLQLTQDVELSATLPIHRSMIIDLNSKKLTSTTLSTIINNIDNTEGSVNLTITDNSFLHTGEISLVYSGAEDAVGIRVENGNKLQLNRGKIALKNTIGRAYGIRISGNSNMNMTSGDIFSNAIGGAYGIYVAGNNDYATLNGGRVSVQAENSAYGIWSSGTINVTNAILTAQATEGNDAIGIYVKNGITVLDNANVTTDAAVDNAYGVNVEAGKFIANRGSFTVSTGEQKAYGINVQSGAQAVVQDATISSHAGDFAYGCYNNNSLLLQNNTINVVSEGESSIAIFADDNATRTIIEEGSYSASSAEGYVYAIKHQKGEITIDGGEFQASSAGDNVYAVYSNEDAYLQNAILTAETTGEGKNVVGFTASAETTHTLKRIEINVISANSTAMGVESNGSMKLSDCSLNVKTLDGSDAYGVKIQTGTLDMSNTNAIVTAHTTGAYGIFAEEGVVGTINGGEFYVVARQAKKSDLKEEESVLYGVKVSAGSDVRIENARFKVEAENTSRAKIAYGVYSSGMATLKDCFFDVSTRDQSYGVWGDASSNLNLNGNEIKATSIGATTSYGLYSNGDFELAGGKVKTQVSTTKSYALFFGESAHGKVKSGKYKALGNVTAQSQETAPVNTLGNAGSVSIEGGFFEEATNLAYYTPEGYSVYAVDNTTAEYEEGYYYQVGNALISNNVCYIPQTNTGYSSLEDAMDYARDHSTTNVTIVMTQPYTLAAGTYTLPSNATLLVPYNRTQISATKSNPASTSEYQMLAEHLRLTFASNAILNVDGIIEVGAEHYYTNIGRLGTVQGPYGRLHLENGSKIVMNNKACLYAWGYVTGDGEIFVKKGAKVYEDFQVNDMKNGPVLLDPFLASKNKQKFKVFPINQYYIQNVEAPTRYYYGSSLIAFTKFQSGISTENMTAIVVGNENALFKATLDDESSWVRKVYDYKKDSCIWETNASAEIGSLLIEGGSYSMDSRSFVLPISNNMKVHAISGKLDITQSMVLLAGAQLEINKEATVVVKEKDTNNTPQDVTLYLYDKDEWGQFAYGKYVSPVAFSPSWTNGKCPRGTEYKDMDDASIYVKGKLEINGTMRTTNGGAKIYSDVENAGTIDYKKQAPVAGEETVYVYASNATGSVIVSDESMTDVYRKAVVAAKLTNAAGFISTEGTESGSTYCYMDMEDGMGARWVNLKTIDACLVQDSETGIFYAKPAGYIALISGEEDVNHLYHAAENDNWTYIRQSTEAGCQWWKVIATETNGVYYCEENGIYYTYNNIKGWEEMRVEVTFYLDEDKSDFHTLTVNYGAKPDAGIISNPTKESNFGYTYQFYGWKSSKTEAEYRYTEELEDAKENMSYTPLFTPIPKKYTITLIDANNGANVPVEVAYGEHPTFTPVKDPTAQYTYYFQFWMAEDGVSQFAIDDELPAVTKATTYTAVWSSTVNKYPVVWKNGEMTLETDIKQVYGAAVSYDGATPTKEADESFAYSFDGWSLSEGEEKLSQMPTVSGDMTFYAHYSTTPRYKVTFTNYDGTQLQQELITQGINPTYKGLMPGRARDLDGYYRFIGWKNSNGDDFAANATLPAVIGKETYTAQYDYVTELYLITLNNVDGAGASWSGKFGVDAMPFYNRDNNDVAVEPSEASTAQYEYTFSGWEPALVPVAGEATYTAQFEQHTRKYNITFANLDGNGAEQTIEVEYGTTPVCPVTPEKATATHTYAFLGWAEGSLAAVTDEATYTAQFSATGTPREFPITFDPDNGVDAPVVINVAYGQTPAYPYANPAKAPDAANTYTFSGWTPAIEAVSGPAEYTAQYLPTIRTFTVTFKNYDGSTIQEYVLPYGATPSPSTPFKPVDMTNRKSYTFTGWEPAIATVTADATYTATYSEVTFVASVTPVGGKPIYKSTLGDAISVANDSVGSTLKLYSNVTGSNNTTISGNFTIDLNGCDISLSTNTTSNTRLLYVTGSLTVMDSGDGGKISYSGSGNANYYTIYSQNSTSEITINGGIIEAKKTGGSSSRNAAPLYNNYGNAYINGGEFIASSTKNAYAVYDNSKSVRITGGKFYAKGNSTTKLFSSGSKTQVSGGYFYTNDFGSATVVSGYEKREMSAEEKAVNPNYNYKVVRVYTVTFQNQDNTVLQDSPKYESGETPAYNGTTPVKEPIGMYTFTGWKNLKGNFYAKDATLPAVTGDETYTAQFDKNENFEVTGDTPVEVDASVETTTVTVSGKLNVADGVTLTTTNLILKASESASGQILDGAGTINATNVYYDLHLNTDARHWHAFGVPWTVDIATNPLVEVDNNGNVVRTLNISRDYEIMYYDGAKRAANGPSANCWKYLRHYEEEGQPVEELVPGKGYMIAFGSHVNTVRFAKKALTPIIYTGSVTVEAYAGEDTDKGINAIANPMAYHASMNAGPTVGYVHDGGEIGSDGYDEYDINGKSFIVGKAVYVQVNNTSTVDVSPSSEGPISPVYAPARRTAKATDKEYLSLSDYYHVSISSETTKGGSIYVLPEEDKEDQYIIGHDLSKFGMSTKKPQIWIKRYDVNLGLNTTAPMDGVAEFPVNVYAPNAGEYTISLASQPDDEYTVYLMRNGVVIWDLSSSAYTVKMETGTDKTYGLRLSANKMPTSIDEAIIDAQGEIRKVIINDKVFIIRGDKVYSVDGQQVK